MDDFEHRVHVDSGRVRYPGQEAIARLRAEVESLQAQLQAGESFHAVAVHQRDAAWGEVETLKATLTQQCKGFRADVEKLEAEVETLRGITPELPPRPPDGGGLPRYGLRHNGSAMPMSVPMADGYWTPYHLAIAEVEALRADAERYRWLREQHWNDSPMCVVMNPRACVKLGSDCPSDERLDAAIDAAIKLEGE